MLSLLSAAAFAQAPAASSVFDVDYGVVLDSSASPVTANGIGAPTVAWDEVDETYVMFFETRTGGPTTDCPSGTWGIGAASSQDGVTWDVWDTLVVAPTPGTPFACVAAHPAVLYEAGAFHLYFKAEQGNNVTVDQGWGTSNWSGVGYASVDLSLDDKTADIAAVDAEIALLEAQLADAVADYQLSLEDFRDSLLAQADEFECQETAPVCAPCGSVAFVGGAQNNTLTTTKDLCQPFSFEIPADLNATGLASAADFVRLQWDAGGQTRFCRERLVSGVPTMQCNANNPGDIVTADTYVLLRVRSTGNYLVSGSASLTALNVQTTTGDVLTTIDLLLATSDPAVILPQLGANNNQGFRQDLTELINWLSTPPVSPDESLLRSEAQALRSATATLRSTIVNTNAQLTTLESERAALVAYTQHLTPTVTADAVALQLNQTFGYPSVAKLGSEYVMLLQMYPNLYRASGATPDAFPTFDSVTPVLSTTQATWARTEVFDPSLYCDPGAPFEYGTWVGGRKLSRGLLQESGASDAVSTDGLAWLLNLTPDFSWGTDLDQYRHLDVVADAGGDLRMYYVNRVGGVNQVHLKSTTNAWTPTDTQNRVCPSTP
jgi:hypothetical protein